jgi:hypothetical protein
VLSRAIGVGHIMEATTSLSGLELRAIVSGDALPDRQALAVGVGSIIKDRCSTSVPPALALEAVICPP